MDAMMHNPRTLCQLLLVFLLSLVINFVNGQERANILNQNLLNETIYEVQSIIEGRIVNGTEAYLGQFPHQVSLRRTWSGSHFCGGNIIYLNWILTAAHCMYINEFQIQPHTITVVAGNVLLEGRTMTRQSRRVRKIIIHKKFDMDTLHNDIALLELELPLTENHATSVAKIAIRPTKPKTICQIAGWGHPSENSSTITNELMFVDLPLLSKVECRELLNETSDVPDGMLCAGYYEGGKDACQGDSGGGMVCNKYLTGIVSGGKGCALPRLPGLYADVYFYRYWIKANVMLTRSQYRHSGSYCFMSTFWLVILSISPLLFSV